MSVSSQPGIARRESLSRLSRLRSQEHRATEGDSSDNEETRGTGNRRAGTRRRTDSSPSRLSFSSSFNQKTPARSYFQRPPHGSLGKRCLLWCGHIKRLKVHSSDRYCSILVSRNPRRDRGACFTSFIRCHVHT